MVLPRAEFNVEDDLVVGTVRLDSFDDPEVRKLALDRLRSSLKKGMVSSKIRRRMENQVTVYERWCSSFALRHRADHWTE